jgi:phenylacetate-CoA ligase
MPFAKLTRRILFKPFLSRHGISGLSEYYNYYKEKEQWTSASLAEYQLNKLKELLIYAANHVKYYKKLFSDISFDPEKFESTEQLNDIPILTKDLIRGNIDDLISDDLPSNEIQSTYTGGTTGVKMKFYRDIKCKSRRIAIQWRSDNWAGWNRFDNLMFIWPAQQDLSPKTDFKRNLIEKYITGNRYCPAGFLGEGQLNSIIKTLIKFKPKIIRCFPSPIVVVSRYIIDNAIEINGVNGVVTTGEPLYPHQREIIEQAFRCKVFNLYASREMGTMAAECTAHKDLHILTDSIYLETVEGNKSLPVGEYGEIVATDLLNYGMPMIRYSMGDYGAISGSECTCGMKFPLLKNVVGRAFDNFIDIDGNIISSPSLVLHLVDDGPQVGQVQVIQKSRTAMLVRFAKDPLPDKSILDFYEENIKNIVKGIETIKFEFVDNIEIEKSGKYRFAICEVDLDDPRIKY